METENQLTNIISDTYQRTLDLAKNITKIQTQFFEEEISKENSSFIKNISKNFRDYKTLTKKHSKKVPENYSVKTPIILNSEPSPQSYKNDKLSKGKSKLDSLIEQSYRLVKVTKTGKSGFRDLTPSPSPVINKIRNKSMISESDSDEKISTYVNMLNGKTEEIELPSFKEYLREYKGNGENERMLKKIENCQKELGNFEKKINGLEAFCKLNPGVPWNNDRSILMKLSSGQYDKSSLIKAYNEQTSPLEPSNKNNKIRRINSFSQKKQASSIMAKLDTSKPRGRNKSMPENKRYLKEIQQAKADLHVKSIKIFNKIQAERPILMRSKASLILKENQKFKGKIHLFEQMNSYKKIIENSKLSKLSNCKTQVKLYNSLLEYLKDYKGMPSLTMISFIKAIKYLIEGGWALNEYSLNEVIKAFTSEELKDLADLIKIVEEFLNKMT